MKDIFENAYFGARYIDIDGNEYIYHKSEKHLSGHEVWRYHYLICKPKTVEWKSNNTIEYAPYVTYVNIDGVGVPAELKYGAGVDRIKTIENSPNKGLLITKQVRVEENEIFAMALQMAKKRGKDEDYILGFVDGYKSKK